MWTDPSTRLICITAGVIWTDPGIKQQLSTERRIHLCTCLGALLVVGVFSNQRWHIGAAVAVNATAQFVECECFPSLAWREQHVYSLTGDQILLQEAHFWIWSCVVFSLIQPQCSSQFWTSEWISWKVTWSKEDSAPLEEPSERKKKERNVQQSKKKKKRKKEGSQ